MGRRGTAVGEEEGRTGAFSSAFILFSFRARGRRWTAVGLQDRGPHPDLWGGINKAVGFHSHHEREREDSLGSLSFV